MLKRLLTFVKSLLALMILVEPVDLLLKHHLADDRCLIDRTERKRVELQELAELGFHVGHDEEGVLRAGSTTAWEVDAWLVGMVMPATRGAGFHFLHNRHEPH